MRLEIATAVLLASCAAPGGPRFVLLESESYGCGAVEGLGCGLAIAPVLDEIDGLEGVAESSVSWDGRYFRIEVLPGADPDHVASAAAGLLEGEACCVTASRGRAAPAEPDQWFNAERLDAADGPPDGHQAGAERVPAARLGASTGLDARAEARILAALERALSARSRQAPDSGARAATATRSSGRGWARHESLTAAFPGRGGSGSGAPPPGRAW